MIVLYKSNFDEVILLQALSGLKEELEVVQKECGRLQLEADNRVLAGKPSTDDAARPHNVELPRPPNELRSSGEASPWSHLIRGWPDPLQDLATKNPLKITQKITNVQFLMDFLLLCKTGLFHMPPVPLLFH